MLLEKKETIKNRNTGEEEKKKHKHSHKHTYHGAWRNMNHTTKMNTKKQAAAFATLQIVNKILCAHGND